MNDLLPFSDVPELRLHRPPSLRLAPNNRIPLPFELRPLIDNRLFQRLRGVKQLGYVDRVYPSANHTRFEHSLGVYFKCIAYVHALWEDPHSDYFSDTVTSEHIRALLIAALVHDLGQYPLSHVLEDLERTAEGFLDDSLYDHEKYSLKLLTDVDFQKSLAPDVDLRALIEGLGTSLESVLSVMQGTNLSDEMTDDMCSLLHSIIDGPIDADKIDYLRRDSYHCGVGFGRSIDEGRFLQALTTVPKKDLAEGQMLQIGLTYKGRVPAEQILIARYHMFTEVYWHRAVRAHEAVLAYAVRRIRRHYKDFDKWFVDKMFVPTTTDEWILAELKGLIRSPRWKDGFDSNVEAKEEADIIGTLIDSVAWTHGRKPFARLVAVSAEHDPDLYRALQSIREEGLDSGKQHIEELSKKFSRELMGMFSSVSLDHEYMVIDIPPRRSPANSVYLVSTEAPLRNATVRLSDHSETWNSFGSAFQERTRKIRVFCPPEDREGVKEAVGKNTLVIYNTFREVARSYAQKVARQTQMRLRD